MSVVGEFWTSECPARGAGLRHAHWADCEAPAPHPGSETVHQSYQCCHCEALVPGIIRHRGNGPGITGAGMSLAQIEARLQGQPMPTAEPVEDDAPVEPAMAQGYPSGPSYGPGRSWWGDGRLNPRDIPRLNHIIWQEEKRGYR